VTGRIDPAFVVFESPRWIVNHRLNCALPGYLMVAARDESARSLSDLDAAALAELGPLLARTSRVIEAVLGAERVYVGRYGHTPGWPVHFHLIPVYPWLVEAFAKDARYDALRRLHGSDCPGGPDGGDLTVYVWREWTTAEGRTPPAARGPSVEEAIERLRAAFRM